VAVDIKGPFDALPPTEIKTVLDGFDLDQARVAIDLHSPFNNDVTTTNKPDTLGNIRFIIPADTKAAILARAIPKFTEASFAMRRPRDYERSVQNSIAAVVNEELIRFYKYCKLA